MPIKSGYCSEHTYRINCTCKDDWVDGRCTSCLSPRFHSSTVCRSSPRDCTSSTRQKPKAHVVFNFSLRPLRLEPPEAFNFKQPDEWPNWRRRFEQYGVASGLSEEGELRQVSASLYCMGKEARDVLTSTNITNEERKSMTL